MSITRLRDLLLADIPASRLVIACDTIGGIGPRPDDSYPADPVWCATWERECRCWRCCAPVRVRLSSSTHCARTVHLLSP
ncbi:alpha-ribazole-5-phosphate synthase CblS [Cutibacterium acnes JCM 18918]|nr:alpha-ribazole-5-phosphate synthase CblS [Cutibacterium acnes JCM 18918]